jgi:polyphenol oxidase
LKTIAVSTGRREGNLRNPATLRRYLKAMQWPTAIATGEQVHGTRVQIVPRLLRAMEFPQSDGLITVELDQPIGIFTADCLPVFLEATRSRAVGLVHAGWRGVRGGILRAAMRVMRRTWSIAPSEVRYWIGPSIGPCCFEVQWDVARHFPATRRRTGGRWTVDLAKEIHLQARRIGMRPKPKVKAAACTMHGRGHYSFRRDATKSRQISIIMRTSSDVRP